MAFRVYNGTGTSGWYALFDLSSGSQASSPALIQDSSLRESMDLWNIKKLP
jgi:hypothetical protein